MLLFPGKLFLKQFQSAPAIKIKWQKFAFLKINFTNTQLH